MNHGWPCNMQSSPSCLAGSSGTVTWHRKPCDHCLILKTNCLILSTNYFLHNFNINSLFQECKLREDIFSPGTFPRIIHHFREPYDAVHGIDIPSWTPESVCLCVLHMRGESTHRGAGLTILLFYSSVPEPSLYFLKYILL